MGNDDIEILDDFSEQNVPNNNQTMNQNGMPGIPDNNYGNSSLNQPIDLNKTAVTNTSSNESVNEFEKMVTESQKDSGAVPLEESNALNQKDVFVSNYKEDLNNELDNPFVNDANNELVKPVQVEEPKDKDLTITAVYPNGFAIDQKEELENTQVIKPKKKSKTDVYLLIIVIVLAITLAVLLVTSYL